MKISFLGTGTSQGVPVIACDCRVCRSGDPRDKRLRTSLLIEDDQKVFVIDAGPDFRQQMLREKVERIDGIFLTHEHKDHIGGMDDLRAFNFKSRKPIEIYSDSRVKEAIENQYPYVFKNRGYRGAPRMNLHLINGSELNVAGLSVLPVMVMHDKLPVYGFRIGEFAYVTDANYISDESLEKLSGIRFFIINALRKEKHFSHFSLDEALEIVEKLSPEKTFITHIGHEMGTQSEINDQLPDNVMLAYDGLSIICSKG